MILSLNNSHVTKEMHSVYWNTAPAQSARLSDYVKTRSQVSGPCAFPYVSLLQE
jgi:hypothetical protein